MEYELWFPLDSLEILSEAVKYPFFTHYWKFYFIFNWSLFEMLLTYETRIYSNAVEQEVNLCYVPFFPFIPDLWMDQKRKQMEVCKALKVWL